MSKSDEGAPPPKKKDAPEAAAKERPLDEVLVEHIATVAKELGKEKPSLPDDHLLMAEHAAAAKLEPWQLKAILARFYAQGLRIHSRVSPEVFKAAADATLKGRI